jgi:hypothetical protein
MVPTPCGPDTIRMATRRDGWMTTTFPAQPTAKQGRFKNAHTAPPYGGVSKRSRDYCTVTKKRVPSWPPTTVAPLLVIELNAPVTPAAASISTNCCPFA